MEANTPDTLIIHKSFMRVNGPDGRAVARANRIENSVRWSVKASPTAEYVEMDEGAARAAIEVAALHVAFAPE